MRVHEAFACEEQIGAIAEKLLDQSLPKSQWTHAAHFSATLWLLKRRTDIDLPRELPDIIRAYNVAAGGVNSDTAGYHETITQASIKAARAFLEQRATLPLHTVCNELLRSKLGDPDWLFDYWSRSRLLSVDARKAWVEPDVRPLEF